MTIARINEYAKQIGLTRGKGTYNGSAYWVRSGGQIVTKYELTMMYYGFGEAE
jgi:hypothetical protein